MVLSAFTFFTYTSLIKFTNNIFRYVKICCTHTSFLLSEIYSCVAFLHYSLLSQPPRKGMLYIFTLQSILHVVADLEITNNTKDCMQADINEQKYS